jgi:formylglycine-generating enzyme required for sulfatase activity
LQTQTPGLFEPALTQIAALNQRTPAPPMTIAGIPLMEVPAGCFFMGSTVFSDTQPMVQQCFDQPFWIGQTEITNAQYALFIQAGGYADDSYWTAAGWDWRSADNSTQPDCWTESDYNQPDQPVVCVSWYEAVAYSNWLTRQAQPGMVFRLPTEAEWEYVARGPDSRVYPWGNEWDATRAVTAETDPRPGAAAAVGSRPAGASWVGALDMSGNVWEWVSSAYADYPYGNDDRENLEGSDVRSLRGGSWGFIQFFARAAYRNSSSPSSRNGSLGFRVVAGSVPPSP